MDYYQASLKLHEKKKGKVAIQSKVSLKNKKDLSTVYTPGMAEPCIRIGKNPEDVYKYTMKSNSVAVISDGSAILGLGNLGARAAIPVVEGKAVIFKTFADIDAIPIVIESQKVDDIVSTIKNIAPIFGGINLEDISAPRCFEVEDRLQDLGIPVMHDDQHGTAVVVLAAITNALCVVKKNIKDVRVVLNGAGAAGTGVAKLLMDAGVKPENMILCDRTGILVEGDKTLDSAKQALAKITNRKKVRGSLADAMKGADVFIGLSVAKLVSPEMVHSMNKDAIILAMANPEPEIMPDLAKKAGAKIVATGRSDFPNQVNNALTFPGIFRGALDARATRITKEMKLAAAFALAKCVKKPTVNKILPDIFDKHVVPTIAKAVKEAWKKS